MNPPEPDHSAHLAIVSGAPAQSFPLSRGASIAGRSPGVALILPSVEVSRQHCRFEWDGETCEVEDLESTRGTTLNGEKVEKQTEVHPGDRIALGSVVLEFRLGAVPPEAPGCGDFEEPEGAKIFIGGEPVDRIIIEGEITVGRDPQGDVWLNDPSVSRRHATLRKGEDGSCTVTDLHSTAGTFLNGHRFDTQDLTVGDRLQIGPFCFQYDGQALVHAGAPRGASIAAQEITRIIHDRVLLDGVTFSIAPSQFTGILGPSGAGKSTLLNALAGLEVPDAGHVLVDGGDIYATGQPPSFGYVPQDDIVHRELTVSQALRFSARLRLASSTPDHEIQRLVEQTMEQLGLPEHAHKVIARLSGGQRKRVSVGVELLAKPAILFLDEPSSGLDPATEFHLMELLRGLADTGCTIVCTTHVVENAYLMDSLLVMVGGVLAFQGDAQAARSYFDVSKLVILYDRLHDQSAQEWKSQFKAAAAAAEPPHLPAPAVPDGPRAPAPSRFALPILLQRQWAILAADWRNFLILFGQPLVIALLVAWATADQDLALFFTYVATLWFGCSNGAQEIVKEIRIFQRERLVGVGTHAYLLSKFLFLFATVAAQGLLLLGAIRFLHGHPEGLLGWQITAVLGSALASVGIGCAISTLARSPMQAVLIVPLVLIPQILLSGFTVKAWEMRPSVRTVSTVIPTYAARTLSDTSFLLGKQLEGEYVNKYTHIHSNLNPRSEDGSRRFKMGEVFSRTGPAWGAIGVLLLWAVATYGLAWKVLARPERR